MAVLEQSERRRFTAEEVERMLAAGILHEDEPVELLEGELVLMTPQDPAHAAATELISRLLEDAWGKGAHARRHSPVAAGPESLPEPDVALVRGELKDYRQRHPTGKDTVLIVEIARTSRAIDRRKAAVYARAGVPVYWLVDLDGRRVRVRSGPQADGEYAVTRLLDSGERVQIPESDRKLMVAELFP